MAGLRKIKVVNPTQWTDVEPDRAGDEPMRGINGPGADTGEDSGDADLMRRTFPMLRDNQSEGINEKEGMPLTDVYGSLAGWVRIGSCPYCGDSPIFKNRDSLMCPTCRRTLTINETEHERLDTKDTFNPYDSADETSEMQAYPMNIDKATNADGPNGGSIEHPLENW